MSLLIFFIFLSIGVSFICSMLEAVILSVTPSYLASLKSKKPALYNKIQYLKQNIEKPLASILTFNTVAHTVGAAGAGAQAQKIFGSEVFALFSAILTFAILFFSEIIPKSLGASSWRKLLPISAIILKPMVFISYPLVWMSEKISSLFKKGPYPISKDEIAAMADIGLRDGALEQSEHQSLKGLIKFDGVKAKDILTPKTKVKYLDSKLSLAEASKEISSHSFSRIPVINTASNTLNGYVLRSQIQQSIIDGELKTLEELTLPLLILTNDISLPLLFRKILARKEHISAITNNKGEFIGVITLEDLIEHMLDLEIYDEQDHVVTTASE